MAIHDTGTPNPRVEVEGRRLRMPLPSNTHRPEATAIHVVQNPSCEGQNASYEGPMSGG